MPSANEKLRAGFSANSPLLLIVNDSAGSVMATVTARQWQGIAYSPYGVRHPQAGMASLLGFNSEKPEPATGHYLLGNGYRGFNPVVMRFNSPDRFSPFERGGLNPYAYCLGDPINRLDPLGNVSFFKAIRRLIAGSRRTHATQKRESLQNLHTQHLDNELSKVHLYARSAGQDPRKVIHQRQDLISAAQGGELKFVMSSANEFAVAPYRAHTDPAFVTHPAIANVFRSKRIVSAGAVLVEKINRNKVTLTNVSGHYRPTVKHLDPAVRILTEMGFKVKTVRAAF